MLNKLSAAVRSSGMIVPGDRVVCAVSGGADSIALLFGLWLLRERLGITLEAAHFNHRLRGAESDGDEAFVRDFCAGYAIPLTCGSADVVTGPKGLEAAARDARYAFLGSLPGKIATAHTADDNAETILMHLLRGTGLRGLGGIAPVNGRIIRPMLAITRTEVEAFLAEYSLPHREDSSNAGDAFLRNRIRHSIMPLLKAENPAFSQSVSAMAGKLRQDESFLLSALPEKLPPVQELRSMHPSLRVRCLERFLKENAVPEPEQIHLSIAESLLFSDCPSASADLPGGVRLMRCYDSLVISRREQPPEPVQIPVPGETELPQWGVRVSCSFEDNGGAWFEPCGAVMIRSRAAGDRIRLSGGSRSLKKWMIDRKIPAYRRDRVAVLSDDAGVLAVDGAGPNPDRVTLSGVCIRIDPMEEKI